MASSYTIYEMTSFVAGDVTTLSQASLIEGVESPRTHLRFERHMDGLPIDVFRATHEMVEYKIGRAKGVTFTEYIVEHHFPLFYLKPQQYLIVKAPKLVAVSAVKALIAGVPEICGVLKKIDLQSIRTFIEDLTGAWFKVLDSVDISSQAMFGPSITRDPRFERASSEGSITFVMLDYPYANETFKVGLSEDYSIVLYENVYDEHLELELIMDVKARLLDLAKPKET